MSSNESAPRDLYDDVSNITIVSKKREIGDKIRAFGKQPKKTFKMVETFSALWRNAELEGVILGSWASKRKQTNGTSFMGRPKSALYHSSVSCNPALKFMQKFK